MPCPPPSSYCTAPGCEDPNPTRQGRRYCEHHEKRRQRCRCASIAQCQCLTAPKQERLSPGERLCEAAHRYADADAEDDAAFAKAKRDMLRAARDISPAAHGELIRQGMAEARRRGVHVGRPYEVDPAHARDLLARLGKKGLVAKALGVSRDAVRRALARDAKGPLSSQQRAA